MPNRIRLFSRDVNPIPNKKIIIHYNNNETHEILDMWINDNFNSNKDISYNSQLLSEFICNTFVDFCPINNVELKQVFNTYDNSDLIIKNAHNLIDTWYNDKYK